MSEAAFKTYLGEIERKLRAGNATEHTYREHLSKLVQELGQSQGVIATNEPKRERHNAPDYVVAYEKGQNRFTLGYIEAKDIGVSLDETEKGEQLTRYRRDLHNLILTDYLEFRWYVNGEPRMTARLAGRGAGGKLTPEKDGAREVAQLLLAFLGHRAEPIRRPKELAERMARLARMIREIVVSALPEAGEHDLLRELHTAFQQVLIPDLSNEDFADMFAQTLAYGLFAARYNHKDNGEPFRREHAAREIPKTNPFLRKLFTAISGPDLEDQPFVGFVDDLAQVLALSDMGAVLKDFGKRTRLEDPVVHFYETFLSAYDPKLRELRGVYYTPEPVVSYIVRSVDALLKSHFGLSDGLADTSTTTISRVDERGQTVTEQRPRVTLLDPACGTGTFSYMVIDHIRKHFQQQRNAGMWSDYVRRHLLPRLFSFELLMAPYAVAHLKLGMQLAGLDLPEGERDTWAYDFAGSERLGIYLTNSLEEAAQRSQMLFGGYLTDEANEAARVKRDYPVMVVLGNPPYSGHSANKGEWITRLLHGEEVLQGKGKDAITRPTHNYFEVDGQPLKERNPKWLNDDYVKFLRFAQWRIEQTGYGILAFITNHGYLDNPTFRGMRQSLMQTFDEIYVLDLHGNTKRKERAPDGGKDENVFDIQQGVSIGIFVRRRRDGAGRTADFPVGRGGESSLSPAPADWKTARGGGRDGAGRTADFPVGRDGESSLSPAPAGWKTARGGESSLSPAPAGWKTGGTPPATVPEEPPITIRSRGYLPHWEQQGATYFVTFRLADSLPKAVLEEYQAEREAALIRASQSGAKLTREEIQRLDWLLSERVQRYLDTGAGHAYLKQPAIAEKVAAALRHFNGSRYRLFAWCIMPNHVHVVFQPLGEHKLQGILQSWKGFTSREANRLLGTRGTFWEHEYYDHLIRDEADFQRVVEYVMNNPLKAGLEDWQWVEMYEWPSVEEEGRTAGFPTGRGGAGSDGPTLADWKVGGTPPALASVHHAHLWGARASKYAYLAEHDIRTTEWKTLSPQTPFYLFAPQDTSLQEEYEQGWKVAEMMPTNSVGITTARDSLTIQYTAEEIWKTVTNFATLPSEEARSVYELGRDARDWQVSLAQKDVKASGPTKSHLSPILYRPFDIRQTYYTGTSRGFQCMPRPEVMRHMLVGGNLGIVTNRQVNDSFKHVLCTNKIINDCTVSLGSGERSYLFPLYLYPNGNNRKKRDLWEAEAAGSGPTPADWKVGGTPPPGGRRANLAPEFVRAFAAKLGITWVADGKGDRRQTFGPEDVFAYLYAIFHAPTYRERYAEFLKIDFPRLPLTSNAELFRALCALGDELVRLHLLEGEIQPFTRYPVKGNNVVESVRYTDPQPDGTPGRVWINKTQYFEDVPPEAWAFHIGGYQVCQKWLKDRKGRALSYDDQRHYQQMVAALAATIRLMEEIDAAIEEHGGWPLA